MENGHFIDAVFAAVEDLTLGNSLIVENDRGLDGRLKARRLTRTDVGGANLSDLSYVYDPDGNLTAETRPTAAPVSASYDGYGRLIGYTRTGEAALTHVYNGMDDRVATTDSSGVSPDTRRFIYAPDGRVLGEYGSNANDVRAEFIWMSPEVGDAGLFGGDDGLGGYMPLAVAANDNGVSQLSWVHGNHMGVPAVYTDASGGEIAMPTGYSAPGFPGQSRTFADLYHNRYRDYDTTTGRYIQADPIGLAGGPSPYSYAMNNPLRYTDPTGEAVPVVMAGGYAIKCLINPLCRAAVAAGAALVVKSIYDFGNDNPFNPVGNSCPSAFYGDIGNSGGVVLFRKNGSGGRSGTGGAYNPPSNRRDNWCEAHQEADRAQCKEAWQFLSADGLRACNSSAFTRYSECLSRGGPHKITTPLFLPY